MNKPIRLRKSGNFDKNASCATKGLAVLLMIEHHLYAFPKPITESLNYGSYTSLFHIVGLSGKICVGIFMFISGYGIYLSTKNKHSATDFIKKATSVLTGFWKYGIISVGLLIFYSLINVSPIELLMNAFCLSSSLNGTWWFMQTYILLLFATPILLKVVQINLRTQFVIGILATIVLPHLSEQLPNNKLGQCIHYLMFYGPTYYWGLLWAKYGIYEGLANLVNSRSRLFAIYVAAIICSFGLRIAFSINAVNILTVISICGLMANFEIKALEVIGEASMGMWLIHEFFVDNRYLAQWMLSITNSPILMLVLLSLISYLLSITIALIFKSLRQLYLAAFRPQRRAIP